MACSEELPLTPLISSQEPLHSLISQPAGLVESSTALLHFPPRQSCLSFFTSLRHDRGKKSIKGLPASKRKRWRGRDVSCKGPWETLSLWTFLIVTFYMRTHLIYSIELCLLKRHQGAKVLKHKLMKQNSSLWPQRFGNKMLTVLWSPESSQVVDYTIVSGWLPYYSRDTGLWGETSHVHCQCQVIWHTQRSSPQQIVQCW